MGILRLAWVESCSALVFVGIYQFHQQSSRRLVFIPNSWCSRLRCVSLEVTRLAISTTPESAENRRLPSVWWLLFFFLRRQTELLAFQHWGGRVRDKSVRTIAGLRTSCLRRFLIGNSRKFLAWISACVKHRVNQLDRWRQQSFLKSFLCNAPAVKACCLHYTVAFKWKQIFKQEVDWKLHWKCITSASKTIKFLEVIVTTRTKKNPVKIWWLSDDATLLINEANKIQTLNSLGNRVSVVQSNGATRL